MSESPWWRDAVIYQVYIRSFADADGDGIGDLAGLREKLPHLRDLGVDALWINPWYASPQVDAGYDVADYRAIEPAYGSLADAEKLIARGPRARAADHPRPRAQPPLRPTTPGSPRRSRPTRAPRSATASSSGPAGAPTAPSRRTTGSRTSGAPPGPASRTGSGTSTCSPPASPT